MVVPVRNMGGAIMARKSDIMTLDDLAEYLDLSKSSLYKQLAQGKIPGQKIGRHWRFSRMAIEKWLQERRSD